MQIQEKFRALTRRLEGTLPEGWRAWLGRRARDNSESVAEPTLMPVDGQWQRLESYLLDEMTRSQSVLQLQDTAALHLDAAHYALNRIAIELTDVMPSITEVTNVQATRVTPLRQHKTHRESPAAAAASIAA